MSDDLIIEVTADPAAEQLANNWPELGLDQILNEEIDEVARLGQSALKSTVPIKTGELRNEQILVFKPDTYKAQVLISSDIHTSSRGTSSPAANVLAALLNLNRYKRSKQSQAENGFPSAGGFTQDWIEVALNEFDRRL